MAYECFVSLIDRTYILSYPSIDSYPYVGINLTAFCTLLFVNHKVGSSRFYRISSSYVSNYKRRRAFVVLCTNPLV